MFKKVTKTRLYELIADEIQNAILSGAFSVGDRLPSEQSFATQFDVSRNVIREALKVLQTRGIIDILDGSGAYVTQPNVGSVTNALGHYIKRIGADSSLKSLYEVRQILEGWTVRLAAERADSHDLENLRDYLTVMQDNMTKSIDLWTDADLNFHIAIAKATHNVFLPLLLEPLVDQLRTVIAEGFLSPGAVVTGDLRRTNRYMSAFRAEMQKARIQPYSPTCVTPKSG
ncbi:MAG: FadR family transcriptional regulator [Chloroflexi bacterium]|nr:FadR family transcriptional regulator [Chloroflexota bacterium]